MLLHRDRLGMIEQWSRDSPEGRAVVLDGGVATLEPAAHPHSPPFAHSGLHARMVVKQGLEGR